MKLTDLRPRPRTLPNGLRVVAAQVAAVHRVVISAHIKVGSRFETEADNGVSHFLEHMMYRGTARHRTAHAQALAFEELGGTLVAATGAESGTMTVAVPAENLEPALLLFAEVFRQPLFDGIEVEKGIVREEILEHLDERGNQVDPDDLLREVMFRGHSLGRPIVGTLEQLNRFDREILGRHHRAHYTALGTVIAIAGPVDEERVIARVEECFEDVPRGSVPLGEPPPNQDGPRFRFVRHSSSQTDLRVGFRAAGFRSPEEPALELLLRVLDDGMATRLYRRICDERGLCYEVSAGYEAFDDCGVFDLAAETSHDSALAVLEEMLHIVSELKEKGPTEPELDKAKARHRWQLSDMLDRPEQAADFHGALLLAGMPKSASERIAELDAVGVTEVRAAAERLFRSEVLSVVAVGLQPKAHRERLEQAMKGLA